MASQSNFLLISIRLKDKTLRIIGESVDCKQTNSVIPNFLNDATFKTLTSLHLFANLI